jgi:hypothetical protein
MTSSAGILRVVDGIRDGGFAARRQMGGLAIVVGSTGRLGRVAEWQTRWLQVPVSFGTWGFKSPFAHQILNGAVRRFAHLFATSGRDNLL